MRILWMCNKSLSDADACGTGSWLDVLARGVMSHTDIQLGFVAPGPVRQISRRDYCQCPQWLVPDQNQSVFNGLPSSSLTKAICRICEEFTPDLIHIWGTEGYWGLLSVHRLLRSPALLEMQGLKREIAAHYYGGLSLTERLRCIGIKELLKRRTMYDDRCDFTRWGELEMEMICCHRFIAVQSPWMAAQVQALNTTARLFRSERLLRAEFAESPHWVWNGTPTVFTSAAYPAPFKGLHLAIRAIAILRRRFPEARLRIAGPLQRAGIRQEGYIRWINSLIRDQGLGQHVDWLGPPSAAQIVAELRMAGATLIPTYIESYCVAMAEAMRMGSPIVAAFTGGTSYLGRDEDTCLFFPPDDAALCAYQLERVLTDQALALQLSREARAVATVRNDRKRLVAWQIETYQQVLAVDTATASPG